MSKAIAAIVVVISRLPSSFSVPVVFDALLSFSTPSTLTAFVSACFSAAVKFSRLIDTVEVKSESVDPASISATVLPV